MAPLPRVSEVKGEHGIQPAVVKYTGRINWAGMKKWLSPIASTHNGPIINNGVNRTAYCTLILRDYSK